MPNDDLAASVADWIEAYWEPQIPLGEWWRRLFDVGYAFPTWPAGLGGFGATAAERVVVSQSLAAAGVIGPPGGTGVNMAAPTLLRHGTAEQQHRFLPGIGCGTDRWCQLFSEPGAGSDLAGLATRADVDGDELVVTGQKIWRSRADLSQWGMLLCRTDRDRPKREGITFVMIAIEQPGIEVRPVRQMNGDAEFCEVFLTEARAKLGDVLGGLNQGWAVARTTLASERAAAAAGRPRGLIDVDPGTGDGDLGTPVGVLAAAAGRADRRPRRPPLLLDWRTMRRLADECGALEDPAIRERLMRYYVRSEVHRLNGRRARSGSGASLDGPLMKLSLAMLAHQSRDVSLGVLGAEGMLTGPVQRTALSSFVPSIGGGTNEIQRNIIGERSLGLPREPGDEK